MDKPQIIKKIPLEVEKKLLQFGFSQETFQGNMNSSIQHRCLEQCQTSESNKAFMVIQLNVGLV